MSNMFFASTIVKAQEVVQISQNVRSLRRINKHQEAIAIILRQSSPIKPFLKFKTND